MLSSCFLQSPETDACANAHTHVRAVQCAVHFAVCRVFRLTPFCLRNLTHHCLPRFFFQPLLLRPTHLMFFCLNYPPCSRRTMSGPRMPPLPQAVGCGCDMSAQPTLTLFFLPSPWMLALASGRHARRGAARRAALRARVRARTRRRERAVLMASVPACVCARGARRDVAWRVHAFDESCEGQFSP